MSGPTGSSTEAARRRWDLLGAALLLAAPLAAAWAGAAGPQRLSLNLGPGDAPYLAGFAPEYEIDDKVGTHWTTYEAAVDLPLEVRGPAELSYRFARVFPETAVVDVLVGDRPVDHFTCRGGLFLVRKVSLGALPATPVRVRIHADSHERKDRGVKLDWVRLETGSPSRVSLRGVARWSPALALLLLLGLHVLAGWGARGAVLLTAPWAAAVTVGLLLDPWLVHRLLRGVPLALAGAGGAGVLIGRLLVARGRASAREAREVAALALCAFLLRALAVNHPDFYYPDLRTHARLVQVLRAGGLDFFRSPSRAIWEHGVWRTEAYGRTYAFPYTPAFHLPFAVPPLSYDSLLTALKLGAAAASVVPLVLVWAFSRRLGLVPWGALLMLMVPTYTSRLSFAFLPSLFGHAVDVAFLYWLGGHLDRLTSAGVVARGAAWVAGAQLAYVSGVINVPVMVVTLAALQWVEGRGEGARRAGALLAMVALGSLVSVALYYRDFLGMAVDLAGRAAGGGAGAGSRYPVESWPWVAYARTRDFFDGIYPPLAAAGLALLWRRRVERTLLGAWAAGYLLLLLGRAKVPDVFLHGHETLLVTPLVCLTAGASLDWLWSRGRGGRALAGLLLVTLAVQGLWLQWRAVAAQLANAQ